MKLNKLLVAGTAALAITAAWGGSAVAQETTAAIRGSVSDESGAAISGATISIINEETGFSRTISTGANGQFNLRNLPVGGSYSIVVNSDGYQGERVEDVALGLGSTTSLTFDLAEDDGGDEIVIVAQRLVAANVATGPSATFTSEDIETLPSTNRDIKDIVSIDPRVYIDDDNSQGIYCAGNSSRYNSLTIDGVAQNDNFGLNDNGYPTQRMPFPFDVVEQINVELAPYDVEYGQFTGCNFNIVSKSGTNEFQGKFFYDYFNEDLQGDSVEGQSFDLAASKEESYGGVLTGPIIKDRLFFTFAYEKFKGSDSYNIGPAGSNAPVINSDFTQAQIDEVRQIAQDIYGYDVGQTSGTFPVQDERYFLKLDAYLTDNQRLELSYQDVDGNNVNSWDYFPSRTFSYSSHWYDRSEAMKVYTGRLFSDWTDALSTELSISYQDRDNGQVSRGAAESAQFQVEIGSADLYFGPDPNRHSNELLQESLKYKAKADYSWNEHLFTFGFERDEIEVFNNYIFCADGCATYASIDDLRNQTPSDIFYDNPPTNNDDDGAAQFEYSINTLYAQDIFQVLPELSVTAGLRWDYYISDDSPTNNPVFQQRYGIRNDANLDGLSVLQPRLGFDWSVTDNTTVTGGIGIFSGGNPGVWISNNYSNTGFFGAAFSDDPAVINGFDGFNIPQGLLDLNTQLANEGQGYVNALDPDYEIPAVTRLSLGAKTFVDIPYLGEDWEIGGDLLYSITDNPNEWRALSLVQVGTAPDGRPVYESQDLLDPDCSGASEFYTDPSMADGSCDLRIGSSGSTDFLLSNSDEKPTAFVASTYARKEWTWKATDFSLLTGYAYSDVNDVNPGTSSTARSSFEGVVTGNPNDLEVALSDYNTTHRFTARFDAHHDFVENWTTHVSLFGEFASGRPYSYTWNTPFADGNPNTPNLFGDTDASVRRSAAYVIDGTYDPNVNYELSDQQAILDYLDFINRTELADYRGEIAPRNVEESSWVGQVDVRIKQDIPLPKFLGNDKLALVLDIDNFTNLLNDEWGVHRRFPFSGDDIIEGSIVNGQYVITDFSEGSEELRENLSLWNAQIGIRYEF